MDILRKININGVDYDISPRASKDQLGMIQLGSGLCITEDDEVSVNIGPGIKYSDDNKTLVIDTDWIDNYIFENYGVSKGEGTTTPEPATTTPEPATTTPEPSTTTPKPIYLTPSFINPLEKSITFYYSDGLYTPNASNIKLSDYYSESELLSMQPECDIHVNIVTTVNTTLVENYLWKYSKTLADILRELSIVNSVYDLAIIITEVLEPEESGYYYYITEEAEPNIKTQITMEGLSLSSTTYLDIYRNNSYVDRISMNVSSIESEVKVGDVLTYSLNLSGYSLSMWSSGRYVLSTMDTLNVTDEVFQKISEYGIISLSFEPATTTPEPIIQKNWMRVVSLEDNNTISLSKSIQYSTDGNNWESLIAGNQITVNKEDVVYFKGTNTQNKFTVSKAFNVEGNVMSLLYGDDFENQLSLEGKSSAFSGLFKSCTTLQNAKDLILPATTLANYCYDGMFSGCTGLTTAPVLSATTLANTCCRDMFRNCTSLTTAPQLPATTLASSCYSSMFSGCTGLIEAPQLPATTLANGCYYNMFSKTNVLPDCSNIDFTNESVIASGGLRGLFAYTKVTDSDLMQILPLNDKGKYYLPATTLADSCYQEMFYGCTSLTTAPELPATTLYNECYQEMFYGCTGLTTAPSVLPATTLASWCYGSMFYGCTSLTTVPELPATTLASNCYRGMFQKCTSLITAPELPATTLADYCYYCMFYGCTSLTEAPQLPATTLASSCYESMFYGCISLTTASELPATTLANYCYKRMFYNCTSLNYIKMLANSINYSIYLENWVSGVSSTGTFVKLADATYITGPNGIPEGWTIENV